MNQLPAWNRQGGAGKCRRPQSRRDGRASGRGRDTGRGWRGSCDDPKCSRYGRKSAPAPAKKTSEIRKKPRRLNPMPSDQPVAVGAPAVAEHGARPEARSAARQGWPADQGRCRAICAIRCGQQAGCRTGCGSAAPVAVLAPSPSGKSATRRVPHDPLAVRPIAATAERAQDRRALLTTSTDGDMSAV